LISIEVVKTVRFWEDIKITIGETLSYISRRDDLVGWVRASTQADMPALADRIARLSKEKVFLYFALLEKNFLCTSSDFLSFSLKSLITRIEVIEFLW